ncbi:hypothetical protein DAEQUDRAFT_266396 [Daedalea quercina L-15889]|uniref:Uncharacterized protein n=1 Tax=Daedalea quercina L-15889 TaxID=1314783 RepID=A0A165QGN7_9APHY|nr:hypothetical protein DAEQUDRAFT_266396 [Daedalea quercina L-15889]
MKERRDERGDGVELDVDGCNGGTIRVIAGGNDGTTVEAGPGPVRPHKRRTISSPHQVLIGLNSWIATTVGSPYVLLAITGAVIAQRRPASAATPLGPRPADSVGRLAIPSLPLHARNAFRARRWAGGWSGRHLPSWRS